MLGESFCIVKSNIMNQALGLTQDWLSPGELQDGFYKIQFRPGWTFPK